MEEEGGREKGRKGGGRKGRKEGQKEEGGKEGNEKIIIWSRKDCTCTYCVTGNFC